MHYVIMGCGRVGSLLAERLQGLGQTVAIVDRDPEAFVRLGFDFTGQRVTGIGFDRDTLIEAGIERADAFAAVSSGDNSNIISARVARETFGVENVVARIYDPRRAEVYERLGITTVATVRWTVDQMMRRLLPEGSHTEYEDPSGSVALAQMALHQDWVGRRLGKLEEAAGAAAPMRVAFLMRQARGVIPAPDTVVQEGDLIYVTALRDSLPDIEQIFARAPEEH